MFVPYPALRVRGKEFVCMNVIKLLVTAQPGPVILIFLCYGYGSSLWGISGVVVVVG